MALSDIEQVRLGIGDITEPYILTDEQIQHYLDSNNGDVSETIEELQPIILSTLASRGSANRIEEVWEDTTKQADSYNKAIKASKANTASNVSPIIGGATQPISLSIDMFDPENVE